MKIVFKVLETGIDLSKVFPVISQQDYELIQGNSLIIPEKEYDKIQKIGYIAIGPYQISKELIEIAQGQEYNPAQRAIQAEVEKTCLYSEDMVDILFKAVTLGKNVIMYGRGGHNKSEGTMKILDGLKREGLITSEPFVQAFGDGLTEESLFGGINIKKFKDTGELEYLFKNSFMEHEIVIFEEIFDAPPQVLLSLKDILTSGYCRKGNQKYKSKTKVIIGLTNRSKEDFCEDDSLEALAQRFPLTLKVEWPSYERKDWRGLFDKVYPPEFIKKNKYKLEELTEILTNNNQAKESFISPRTAVHAADLYCAGGNLKLISDIDHKTLDLFYKANKDREKDEADADMFKSIEEYITKNDLFSIDSTLAILQIALKEHKARTGEDIQVDNDTSSNAIKVSKLEYIIGLIDIHSWSSKNIELAGNRKKELRENILELKKI